MDTQFNRWAKAEAKKLLRKKNKRNNNLNRSYLHIDNRLTLGEFVKFYSEDFSVKTHEYMPLLSYIKEFRRFVHRNDINKAKKQRLLSYASHKDAFLYSWYGFQLNELYEKRLTKLGLSDCIIAYRSSSLNHKPKDTISSAIDIYQTIIDNAPCVAIALDVSKFFPTISHSRLKLMWTKLLGVDRKNMSEEHFRAYKSLIRFSHIDIDKAVQALKIDKSKINTLNRLCTTQNFRTILNPLIEENPKLNLNSGIPQGTPISGILSNVALLEFDEKLNEFVKSINGHYRRYCDDIVVICKDSYKSRLLSKVKKLLKAESLQVNSDKTEIIKFEKSSNKNAIRGYKEPFNNKIEKPLQYLGLTFDGEKIVMRPSTISRYMRKMKGIVRKYKNLEIKRFKNAKQNNKNYKPILKKKKIYKLYSHLGSRNLISYAGRVSDQANILSNLKKQLKAMNKKLNTELQKAQSELNNIL